MKYSTIISDLMLCDKEKPALFNNSFVSSNDSYKLMAKANAVGLLGR